MTLNHLSSFGFVLNVPNPALKVNVAPTGGKPFLTPEQWPNPSVWPSQANFAVACCDVLEEVPCPTAHALMTTKQEKSRFAWQLVAHVDGMLDGFQYEDGGTVYTINPRISVDRSFGVVSGPTGMGGDSSGLAAGYLWLPGPASIALNSFVEQARWAAEEVLRPDLYDIDKRGINSYVIDARKELAKWWGGEPKAWLSRLPSVLIPYASTGVPLTILIPPWANAGFNTAFVDAMTAYLGSGVTFLCEWPSGTSVPEQFQRLVTIDASYTVVQFQEDSDNDVYNEQDVVIEAGANTLLTLMALLAA